MILFVLGVWTFLRILMRRRGQRQPRECRPTAAVGGAAAISSSPESVPAGSTLLGLPFTPLDGLAVQLSDRLTPHRPCLASQGLLALPALENAPPRRPGAPHSSRNPVT